MLSYVVIGICVILLLAVIFISAKPISMGIEARREIKENSSLPDNKITEDQNLSDDLDQNKNITDEIIKLNRLREEGVLNSEEYEKAKKKILD